MHANSGIIYDHFIEYLAIFITTLAQNDISPTGGACHPRQNQYVLFYRIT